MPAAAITPATIDRSPLVSWLAVVAVTFGIFTIVTTEIMPIGLLTSIGASFDISDGAAGLMMTMPGFLAAVAAPTVTVMTGRLDRRVMLSTLMLVFALANFLAAVASAYWIMMVSRVLVGFVIGAFWSIGAGLAARLVRAERSGRATAVIFSAVPLGSVFGVPAGTLIGNVAHWRMAFVVLGILSLIVFVGLVAFLPPLPAVQVTRFDVLRGMLQSGAVRAGLLITFLIVLAHFGTYTYVTPFLENVSQIDPAWIAVFLLAYGAAGVVGNFVAGTTVSRHLQATFGTSACMLAAALCCCPCSDAQAMARYCCSSSGTRLRRGARVFADLVLHVGSARPGGSYGPLHRVVSGDHLDRGAGGWVRRRRRVYLGRHAARRLGGGAVCG
jgi:predicted MFS family arabinose efflux permease